MKKIFEFIGEPSGDGESFCWDVDRETFTRVTNKEPSQFDECGNNLFKLYPDDLYELDKYYTKHKMKIIIERED